MFTNSAIMAFNTDITLNPSTHGGTGGDLTYSEVAYINSGEGKLRRVSATASTAPDELTISHREQPGKVKADQHLVRIDTVFSDPVLGPVTLSSWVVMRVPKGTSVVSVAGIKDQLGRLIHFLRTTGYVEKLLNSEP